MEAYYDIVIICAMSSEIIQNLASFFFWGGAILVATMSLEIFCSANSDRKFRKLFSEILILELGLDLIPVPEPDLI
jgi:hypothetical protein